jgi:hypothetical protein
MNKSIAPDQEDRTSQQAQRQATYAGYDAETAKSGSERLTATYSRSKSDLESGSAARWIRISLWIVICLLSVAKCCYLRADFPNYSLWMIDQAKFTDEGWWGSAAVMHYLTGHWYVAGDYNPAVPLPIWPALLAVVFRFTGVTVTAARGLNVALSFATLWLVFVLVRRFSTRHAKTLAVVAVVLLAASPFGFVFNRLAILETLVVFEFCLALLVASFVTVRRTWPLVALVLLIAAMMLTKTTSALLIPAILWMAWWARGRSIRGFLVIAGAAGVVPLALVKGYSMVVARLGYGADYSYFFGVNGMPDIDWKQTYSTMVTLFQNCFWVDRVLYPVSLVILLVALLWKRKLWANPLFSASWIAMALDGVFVFSRQDDYAPRYFLVMLAPLVMVVVLMLGELIETSGRLAVALSVAIVCSIVMDTVMISQFMTHRDYQFYNAARSIREIVHGDRQQDPLIAGVSGAQISLMTGIPSINDGLGTEDMVAKVEHYHPGWYLAWNDINLKDVQFLNRYKVDKVASYPVFDDDDRTVLTLYKLLPRGVEAH